LVFVVPEEPAAVEAHPLVVRAQEASTLGVRAGPLTARTLGTLLSGDAGGLLARLGPRTSSATRGIGGLSEGAVPDGATLQRLHALWRVLVPDGLWPRLTRAPEVLVVPDGPLFRLPFEALVVKAGADAAAARFWLDAGPVLRYAPSATLVRDLPRHAQDKPAALTVADPVYSRLERLPATAREAAAVDEALTGLVEVTRLEAGAAREPAVRKEMAGKRYLHLATHGLLGGEEGELFAGLALTAPPAGTLARGDDDGFLQLHEIYGLPLSAELAVLSACDSNTGRLVEGEGVFALSRGFLVAGARRVIASQWPVDDVSTAALMGDLFRRIGEGAEPAHALRDAKRALRKNPAWSDPFFWAPFVLTGAE
jgi:CHAT domain-containing protein